MKEQALCTVAELLAEKREGDPKGIIDFREIAEMFLAEATREILMEEALNGVVRKVRKAVSQSTLGKDPKQRDLLDPRYEGLDPKLPALLPVAKNPNQAVPLLEARASDWEASLKFRHGLAEGNQDGWMRLDKAYTKLEKMGHFEQLEMRLSQEDTSA